MTWLTWRQMRTEALVGGFALVSLALYLIWTGREIMSAYQEANQAGCLASDSTSPACREAAANFINRYGTYFGVSGWLILVPFLIGLLLAAPTVLELEQGTYRLAWTQGITRARWFATRIGFGLAIAIGVSAALIALWTWWREPFDAIEGRWNGTAFYVEGPVTFAHLVFTFAVCLAVGALLRRTIPTVGITFVVFLVLLLVVENVLRPRYMEPEKFTFDPAALLPEATQSQIRGGDHWVISEGYSDVAGNVLAPDDPTIRSCMAETASKTGANFNNCLQSHDILFTYVYQPANRFWIFQGIETAIFLGMAAVLLGFTFYWITRRIAR
jgi:hypothetical protein